jgi:hypothetical protein
MTDTLSTTPPFVIYLQTEDDWSEDPLRVWDMTWHYERINKSDVRYIKDDQEILDIIQELCEYVGEIEMEGGSRVNLTPMAIKAHKVWEALDHIPGENNLENEAGSGT